MWIAFKATIIRTIDVLKAPKYDVIIIYREAHFIGSTIFERLLSKSKAKLIYDFDDAIWLNDTSEANSNLKWLKKPSKIENIIALANEVVVGNAYLAEFAKKVNPKTVIIPTTIDAEYYKNGKVHNHKSICIGWTGSSTTIKHFKEALPFLKAIKEKYKDKVSFLVIADAYEPMQELEVDFTPWSKQSEIDDLNRIDIGIMPLPNDEWSKGKCGFKGIQYMAMEKPCILSPVGVNTEIIINGENGFLADSNKEWIGKLSQLIESPELRNKLGKAGRKTIQETYSVQAQKDRFLKTLLS